MGVKIFAAVFLVLFALFLLSVFAPMQSKSRFWAVIHKIRAGMDRAVYWFFNICAILSISYLILATVSGMLRS